MVDSASAVPACARAVDAWRRTAKGCRAGCPAPFGGWCQAPRSACRRVRGAWNQPSRSSSTPGSRPTARTPAGGVSCRSRRGLRGARLARPRRARRHVGGELEGVEPLTTSMPSSRHGRRSIAPMRRCGPGTRRPAIAITPSAASMPPTSAPRAAAESRNRRSSTLASVPSRERSDARHARPGRGAGVSRQRPELEQTLVCRGKR
jgi:hypothetical protein